MLLQLLKLQSKGSFFFIAFILGIFLSLGFDPFNVPFISLVIVGLFFKLNDKFYLIYQKSYNIITYNILWVYVVQKKKINHILK